MKDEASLTSPPLVLSACTRAPSVGWALSSWHMSYGKFQTTSLGVSPRTTCCSLVVHSSGRGMCAVLTVVLDLATPIGPLASAWNSVRPRGNICHHPQGGRAPIYLFVWRARENTKIEAGTCSESGKKENGKTETKTVLTVINGDRRDIGIELHHDLQRWVD